MGGFAVRVSDGPQSHTSFGEWPNMCILFKVIIKCIFAHRKTFISCLRVKYCFVNTSSLTFKGPEI